MIIGKVSFEVKLEKYNEAHKKRLCPKSQSRPTIEAYLQKKLERKKNAIALDAVQSVTRYFFLGII